MSAASLHLAGPEDLPKLTHLLGQAEAEAGLPERTDAERAQSLTPLVAGGPEGAAYLIGPRRAPVGFLALGFAYSLARGGLTGRIEALWIRGHRGALGAWSGDDGRGARRIAHRRAGQPEPHGKVAGPNRVFGA